MSFIVVLVSEESILLFCDPLNGLRQCKYYDIDKVEVGVSKQDYILCSIITKSGLMVCNDGIYAQFCRISIS